MEGGTDKRRKGKKEGGREMKGGKKKERKRGKGKGRKEEEGRRKGGRKRGQHVQISSIL